MRRFLLAALLIGTAYAQSYPTSPTIGVTKVAGQSLVLTWTAPTENTDNSPITGTLSYNVYSSTGGAFALRDTVSTTTDTRTNLAAGTPCYYVTAVENGVESPPSNIFCAQVTAAPPNAPTNLTGN